MLEFLLANWETIVTTAIIPVATYLFKQIVAQRKGMRALLRADLIRLYNKYNDDLGYCPIYVKTAVEDEYKQYHALGGNGAITELYEDLMELPTKIKSPIGRKEV